MSTKEPKKVIVHESLAATGFFAKATETVRKYRLFTDLDVYRKISMEHIISRFRFIFL